MALFNSSSPAYKTASSPNAVYAPVAPSSGLAGLFGSLVGGSTPTYKTLGQAGRAPAAPSSGLMRIFIGTDPTYKTAQLAADADVVDNDDDDDDGACDAPIDTVVVL